MWQAIAVTRSLVLGCPLVVSGAHVARVAILSVSEVVMLDLLRGIIDSHIVLHY